jgi:hypothetical protein
VVNLTYPRRVDWPNAWVAIISALAAAIGTASVAIWALKSQQKNAEADRTHDLEVRRAERRHAAYIELMVALHQLQMAVDRTEPIMSTSQDAGPPPNLSDEEYWRLNALSDVSASDAIRALVKDWFDKAADFYAEVGIMYEIRRREGPLLPPTELERQYGVKSSVGQWQKVDATRRALQQILLAVGAQIREEL